MSDKASLMQQPAPLTDVGLQREIAALFVQALNLEVQPQDIDPEAARLSDGIAVVRQPRITDDEYDRSRHLQPAAPAHGYLVLCAAMCCARCLRERNIC